jgi:glycine hydroxymethyltransferase
VGTPALTSRGVNDNEIPQIVELIDKVILSKGNEQTIESVRKEVNALMQQRPLFQW